MRPFRPLPLLHGLALLVLFAFPWMTVSCPSRSKPAEPNRVAISGLQLALIPGSMPKPQPPEGWSTPTNPAVKRDRPVLDAEHPSYWLIPLAAILTGLLAVHKLRAAQNFRRTAFLVWALACLALAQGAIRDARLYQGSPWGYRLEWRLPFWFTVALLPPLGLWAVGTRPTQKPVAE